jgi:hypothetical protein
MVLKINPLVIGIILLFFSTKSIAQPGASPLESHSYLPTIELTKLLNVIESAPLIEAEGECNAEECKAIEIYRNAIINLKEDLYEYQSLVKLSATVSKNSWENYLNQTIAINNEDLKGRMQLILAWKDALAQTAALIVDVVDIHNILFVKKDYSGNPFEKLIAIVDVLDEVLSIADVCFKVTKEDLDTNTITEVTGKPELYSGYTTFKGAFDILKESLTNLDNIKAWSALSSLEKLKAMDKPSVRNVGTAVVNLLGIYSNYERNLMRDAIKEFEEVLAKNDNTQNLHYDKYKLKIGLIGEISRIISKISLRQESMRTANLKCNVLTFTRAPRKNHDSFGEGLRYYKSILITATANIHLSWKDVKSCVGKSYSMIVYDGVGKVRTAYLEIKRNSDKKIIFKESIDSKTKFKLTADSYLFKLHSGRTKNGIRNKEAIINYYIVKGGDESKIIELSPFGRVSLKVVDKSGKPQPFRYIFYNNDKKIIDHSFSTIYKEEIMDLPVNTVYSLELNYGDNIYEVDKKEDIRITAKKLNNLHFIYDDGKFINDSTKTTDEPTVKRKIPKKRDVVLKDTPVGWVTGILYNSNDGNCNQYKGKYLRFRIMGRKIFNRETGVYSDDVMIAPGERLHVAVLEDEGHFRAYPVVNPLNSDGKEDHISFWYYSDLINGWWYAAGCDDGTKPSFNCDNGRKVNDGKPRFCRTINN